MVLWSGVLIFLMICRSLSWICKVWGAASGRQSQHWRKIWSVDVWRWIQPSGSHLWRPWTMDGFRWLGRLGDTFTARSLCGWPRKFHNILNRPRSYCPRFGYLMIFGSLGSLGNHDVSGCFKYMIVWIFRYGVGMLKPHQIAKAWVRVFQSHRDSPRFTIAQPSWTQRQVRYGFLLLPGSRNLSDPFTSFKIRSKTLFIFPEKAKIFLRRSSLVRLTSIVLSIGNKRTHFFCGNKFFGYVSCCEHNLW